MLRIVLFPTQRKAAEARPGGEGQPGQGCHVAEAAARGEGEVGDTCVREGEEEVEAVVLEVLAADLGEGGRGEGREGAGRGGGRAKGGEGREGKDELGLVRRTWRGEIGGAIRSIEVRRTCVTDGGRGVSVT